MLAYLTAVLLLGVARAVSADEVIVPGETYTPDMIGPSVTDSYAERQARGGQAGSEPWIAPPPAISELPEGELISQSAGMLTGSPPTLVRGFAGAHREAGNWPVPDTMGAVGPEHFMEVINQGVSIFSKSSPPSLVSSEYLESFFSVLGVGFLSDPRVLFDQRSQRWIVVATAPSIIAPYLDNKILLAVSYSSDPRGPFFYTSFQVTADNVRGFAEP
ncbi:MAG: hypothetical protein HY287_06760 [Planctomycetes bacterium]|nr:hypothetical protein [Planctomycetota bacterium]